MKRLALAAVTLVLPSPLHPLSPTPPLGGSPATETEGGVLHRVDAMLRVAVSVDETGRPFSVRAGHRLVVRDKGDYVFAIPAPVVDVARAPGSESTPGQRRDTILWAGFDPGRKMLAADARLDLARTARDLPLRVSVSNGAIRLSNATVVRAGTFAADAVAPPLARYLDAVRSAARRGRPVPAGTAQATSTAQPGSTAIEAPLHVQGTVGGRRVDVVLGDGRPLGVTVPNGDGHIALSVQPVPPLRLLTPAGGGSWRASGVPGRELLERANDVLLRLARMRQYDAFLANPDPRGSIATSFVYRTGTPPAAVPPAPVVTGGDGRSWLVTALVAAGCVAAFAGAIVVWARS